MRRFKKYVTAVRAEFANNGQFALNFVLQSIQLPVAIAVLLYIYQAISGGRQLGQYSALKLALYFVGVAVSFQVAMPAMTTMWESWEQINKGDLANYLCRPIDYLGFRYARKLAPALVVAACAMLLYTVVHLMLGDWSLLASFQYVLAALMAFSLWFMFWFLMGAVSFWWERPFGLRDILINVIAILSGQTIPLDWLHPAVQQVIGWLPFQSLVYVPASLFAGTLAGAAAWRAIGQQAVWLVAMTAAARTLWHTGARGYDGRGG